MHREAFLSPTRNVIRSKCFPAMEMQWPLWGQRSRNPDGFQGCCNPMAVADVGTNELVTVEAGQVRVKSFTKQGELLSEITGPESFETLATTTEEDRDLGCSAGGVDVATSPEGDLFLLHSAAHKVVRYARS